MTEGEPPTFSEALIERLTTTQPIDLLSETELKRIHDDIQACQEARLETERHIQTLYLD